MKKSYELDMCNGPILGKILVFAIPLMISGILQLLFNTADIIVVGRFTGSQALAAVGSTSALINLIINLFIGVSVGANVVVARNYGAKDYDGIHGAVHTSVLTAIWGGIILIFVGILLARPMLEMMGTPEDDINLSVLYMRIYFVGMPAFMMYNFGAAILRAIGDTKRPLYFLTLSGVVNVVLNLFFVIVFHMGVAGVALATIISQAISAFLIILCLMKMDGPCHLDFKHLKFHPRAAQIDAAHRSACRLAGSHLQHFQRPDSVLCQLLRLSGHGGQHRRGQHRRLCLQLDERCLPDLSELYQPEYGRQKV